MAVSQIWQRYSLPVTAPSDPPSAASYSWQQLTGDSVSLRNRNTPRATFLAPSNFGRDLVLIFRLSVNYDSTVLSDDVVITVAAPQSEEDLGGTTVTLIRDDIEGRIVGMSSSGGLLYGMINGFDDTLVRIDPITGLTSPVIPIRRIMS